MECPHCQQEIPGKSCPQCGLSVPSESRFCMDCGAQFDTETVDKQSQTDEEFELDDRVLCPDGTCTGIMIDGKCSECGKSESEHEPEPIQAV